MRAFPVALHVAALLLGAWVGLASVAVHRAVVLGLPAGMALAVATSLAVIWALRCHPMRRLVASYAAGWLTTFGVVMLGRPEGDYAIAADLKGYVMIGTAFALVAAGISSLGSQGSRSPGAPT